MFKNFGCQCFLTLRKDGQTLILENIRFKKVKQSYKRLFKIKKQ